MPRRNGRPRFDKGGYSAAGAQKGKGGKRRRDWHHARNSAAYNHDPITWPDLGTGADPTSGAPIPLRARKRNKGSAVT
jgi:hypothetical protein